MKVLKVALDSGRYDLAAHALVFALVKVSKNGQQPTNVKAAKPTKASKVLR
jgi:hypothetical protein